MEQSSLHERKKEKFIQNQFRKLKKLQHKNYHKNHRTEEGQIVGDAMLLFVSAEVNETHDEPNNGYEPNFKFCFGS